MLTALETFLYRRADHVVYMAEGVHAHVAAQGVPEDRLTFIPNGADSEDFSPSAPREALRGRYGFGGVVAIYTGAHGPANGLDLVLDAAHELEARLPEVRLVLVGDGVDKQRLVERARRESMTNVAFLDPVPKSEIADLLAASDIGVHCLANVTMFRDGVSPNKLFDYMAAGLPVITNTPGVVSAYVNASAGGVAVTPTGLADGIAGLALLDVAERTRIGAAGAAHLRATRSRTAMAVLLQHVLDEAVAARAIRRRWAVGRVLRRRRSE